MHRTFSRVLNLQKNRLHSCDQTSSLPLLFCYGLLAQLVERLNGIEEVSSSRLLGSTTLKATGFIPVAFLCLKRADPPEH